jgi:Mrp family chromosome partitioning ATPase
VVELGDRLGLSETLQATGEQKLALLTVSPTLTLLPAGRPVPDPIGVLTSARMRAILDEASARFDWVVLDAPPVGPLADARLLTEMVQATLLVIRSGRTQYAQVQKAVEAIGRERILGVVLNGVEDVSYDGYEYYAPGKS